MTSNAYAEDPVGWSQSEAGFAPQGVAGPNVGQLLSMGFSILSANSEINGSDLINHFVMTKQNVIHVVGVGFRGGAPTQFYSYRVA